MLTNINSLSNLEIGGPNQQQLSIRFLAKSAAPLAGLRYYAIWKNPGYGAGNTGRLTHTLRGDAPGAQPGAAFAGGRGVLAQNADDNLGGFPLIYLDPAPLTKGAAYHLVITNTDSEPAQNWQSLDVLQQLSPPVTGQTPDMEILASQFGGPFEPPDQGRDLPSPIALFYADGTVQGYGFYQLSPTGLMGGEAYGFPASICV